MPVDHGVAFPHFHHFPAITAAGVQAGDGRSTNRIGAQRRGLAPGGKVPVAILAVDSADLLGGGAFPDRDGPPFHEHLDRLLHFRQGQVVLPGRIHHIEVLLEDISVNLSTRTVGREDKGQIFQGGGIIPQGVLENGYQRRRQVVIRRQHIQIFPKLVHKLITILCEKTPPFSKNFI